MVQKLLVGDFFCRAGRWVGVAICLVSVRVQETGPLAICRAQFVVLPPPRPRSGLMCVWEYPPTHGGHMLFREPILEVHRRYLFFTNLLFGLPETYLKEIRQTHVLLL